MFAESCSPILLHHLSIRLESNPYHNKGLGQDNRKTKNKNTHKNSKVKNTKRNTKRPSKKSPIGSGGSEVATGNGRFLYTAPPVGASQGLKTDCGSECGRKQ